MHVQQKFDHLVHSHRDPSEVERWLFSLIPLGVAFVFFFLLILPMEIPNEEIVIVAGLAAGFAGVQGYWVVRGWQREEGLTILLGVLGIVLAGLFVWTYSNFLMGIVPSILKSWAR